MKIDYIAKNLTLLNLIDVNEKLIVDLCKEIKNKDLMKDIVLKYFTDKNIFNFDKLNLKEIEYVMSNKKYLPVTRFLKESNVFYERPYLFRNYIMNITGAEHFIMYKKFTEKYFSLLSILDEATLYYVSLVINKNIVFDFIDYLIEKKHRLIFPVTKNDEYLQFKILGYFSELPKSIEKYLAEDSPLLKKIKGIVSEDDIINNFLNSRYNLEKALNDSSNDKYLDVIYSKITNQLLNNKIYNLLPKDISFKLLNSMCYEELREVNLSKENMEFYFINNLSHNLYFIPFMDTKLIKKLYKEIRESILNGTPIGKQGLKYFLVKNKNKLDTELLIYVLNKYPKFYNSLKIKDNIKFKSNIIKKEFDLKTLIYKVDLDVPEKKFIVSNIRTVLKIKINSNVNDFTKKLILKEIEFSINNEKPNLDGFVF